MGTSLRKSRDDTTFQLYFVKGLKTHEKFNRRPRKNDISILQVDRKITFNSLVQPITLPDVDFTKSGDSVVAVGWGASEVSTLIFTFSAYIFVLHYSTDNINFTV